jgi:hypothetical protein
MCFRPFAGLLHGSKAAFFRGHYLVCPSNAVCSTPPLKAVSALGLGETPTDGQPNQKKYPQG